MRCPQCGAEISDEAWNCASCGMNVYWATQHFEDLARAREEKGLPPQPDTPAFLRRALERAEIERNAAVGRADDKVRQVARRTMQRRDAAKSDGDN